MPVEVTPTKKIPSKRGSRARSALYRPLLSFVIILIVWAGNSLALAVFGHRNKFNVVSENGEYYVLGAVKLRNMKTNGHSTMHQTKTLRLRIERWESPMCPLLIVTDHDGVLRAIEFGAHESRMERLLRSHYGDYTLEEGKAPVSLKRALEAYFKGEIDALAEVKTATDGTP